MASFGFCVVLASKLMTDSAQSRIERLRRLLRDDPVDALLIVAEQNVRYLTGFTGDSSILLVTVDRTLLISDGRYTTQLAEECPGLEIHIRPVEQLLFDAVGEVVGKLGAGSVGFEPAKLSVARYETICERAPGVDLVGVAGRVERLRSVKDEGEVATIRRAIQQAERGFVMLRAGIRPEDSEKDLADALDGYLRRCGASGAAFPPMVAVGARAALPHAHPMATSRVADADFVLVDWGAAVGGYKSDLTRLIVTGKVTPKFAEVYRAVLEAQRAGIAALLPGASAGSVDTAARSVIEAAGFGPSFNHGLGHGFGLEIHESPFFRRDNSVILEAWMVVTIEPGIYLPGWGGVRVEDDVLITPDGPEVLTSVPKSLEDIVLR